MDIGVDMKIRMQKDEKGRLTGKFHVISDFDPELIPEGYVRISDNLYGPANILPCIYRSFVGNPNAGQSAMKCSEPSNESILPVIDCIGCEKRVEITTSARYQNNVALQPDVKKVECRHQRVVKTGCCKVTLCGCKECPLVGRRVTNEDCTPCDHREI